MPPHHCTSLKGTCWGGAHAPLLSSAWTKLSAFCRLSCGLSSSLRDNVPACPFVLPGPCSAHLTCCQVCCLGTAPWWLFRSLFYPSRVLLFRESYLFTNVCLDCGCSPVVKSLSIMSPSSRCIPYPQVPLAACMAYLLGPSTSPPPCPRAPGPLPSTFLWWLSR